jgi:sugar/nucleoside kinase (ribokinase family)
MEKKYDVCGIGTPVVDVLINAEDSHIDELRITKGATDLIDEKKAEFLMNYFKKHKTKIVCGGDCCNTLIGIASLGGKAVFSGNIGLDEYGRVFESGLKKEGVMCNLNKLNGKTSSCFILVTPDSERSMNLLLSNCENNNYKINREHIINSRYIYVTGHMFDNPHQIRAVITSMKLAKKHNVRVAFDLGDPNSVKKNKRLFHKLIKEYVNVLFANEEEAEIFAGKSDYMESLNEISKKVDVAIVKIGSRGSVIKYKNKIIKVKPFKTNAVDTTGAGDMYAAGFLYGLSQKYSLERSGKIASFLSSKVVENYGARIDSSLKEMISSL